MDPDPGGALEFRDRKFPNKAGLGAWTQGLASLPQCRPVVGLHSKVIPSV